MFGATFLATGAALLTYILSGVSLLGTVALVAGCAALTGGIVWRRASGSAQADLRRRIRTGLLAGLLATGAYDLSRFLLIEVTGFQYWPFDIFTLFGQALLGSRTGAIVMAAGIGYHLANGVGFGLAYTIWLGQRGVLAGVAWAMTLETIIVTIYPGWLGLKALDEFLSVSIVGHLVYGSVLGFTARSLLAPRGGEGARA